MKYWSKMLSVIVLSVFVAPRRQCVGKYVSAKYFVEPSSSGSATIASVLTLVFGVGFVLLFANVSQYVSAKAATEHAAQRAARCVAAIEGGCFEEEPEAPAEEVAWFGKPSSLRTEVFLREGNYSVNVPHTQWRGEVQRQQLRSERHVTSWPEFNLPVTRVVGVLNSFARLEAKVTVSLRDPTTGSRRICELDAPREISWGMSFDEPSAYFDNSICGSSVLEEVANASTCAGRPASEDYELFPHPSWDNSYCSLQLPGVHVEEDRVTFSNSQPWLLLGGTPTCEGSAPSQLSQTVPQESTDFVSSAETKPFPVVNERQYVIIDVVSCDSADAVQQKVARLLDPDATPAEIAEFLGATHALGGEGSIYDPYEFSDFRNADTPGFSYFLSKDSPNAAFFSAADNWTYLRWERQVEKRNPEDGSQYAIGDKDAQRTVLTRKICSWHSWEEAESRGFSALEYAPEELEPIRLSFHDGSCARAEEHTPAPQYVCKNRVSHAPQGEINEQHCQGWASEKQAREQEYQQELERLALLNNRSARLADELAGETPKEVLLQVDWLEEGVDTEFTILLNEGERRIDEEYLEPLEALQFTIETADVSSGTPRRPQASNWQGILETEGLDTAVGWKEFLANPQLNFTQSQRYTKEFSGIEAFTATIADKQYTLSLIETLEDSTFDSDVDCVPERGCAQENARNLLSERLWQQVASRYEGTLPPLEDLAFSFEAQAGSVYQRLGEFSQEELIELREQLPTCAAVQTSCRMRADAEADFQFAGFGNAPPELCRSGVLQECYPEYDEPEPPLPMAILDVEKAKRLALTTLRELYPGTQQSEACSSANCLEVFVEEDSRRVLVTTAFEMPIYFPLSTMLNQDTIRIESAFEQSLETALLE